MILRMNYGYSERLHVTNHNSEWGDCIYIVPSQMAITPEITIPKVIGQATNPFIHVSDDFASYQGLEYRYSIIPVQMDVTQEITRYNVIGQHSNPLVGIAEDFVCFIGRYSDYFTVNTRSVATQAEQYIYGLMQVR